ncbi:NAD(P)/FAD-dependent oxidoreductase [Candidatus Woesearchaeota archaeon]|nr:NAD(P)/FAD-dependent oxidoreductase [Candidatus Woesearchaeota archaeon]
MKYDIICIGAGSGGLGTSMFMNKAGFKVLLIDKSDRSIGGDCLNHGCVPSKALIHSSRLVQGARESKEFGLKVDGKIDLAKVSRYVDDKREVIREHENANYLRKLGLDVVLGAAKFNSKNSVVVNGQEYFGKKIVIATGSRPMIPNIKGIEKIKYYTNENIFELDKLPNKMIVIGGGPIGVELGQCFQRFGSEVIVIQRGPQFLPKEDVQIADILRKRLEKEGMRFMFNTSPLEFTSKNELIVEDKNGKKSKLKFDLVLVSAGRTLNIDNLYLDKAGIKVNESKIIVDNYLRTTNKDVLVIGDAAGSYQFTHCAEIHVRLILSNFFSPFKKKVSYDHLSWVTYTTPEVATFGLNIEQLNQRKIKYRILEKDFKDDDRAIVDNASYGKAKVYVDNKGKLLGGTMIAENAGEVFQELVLANSAGLNVNHLFSKIYPYPTASRINQAVVKPIFEGKLTPFVKKLFKLLYH